MWNLLKCLSTTLYADDGISFLNLRFENDVNVYGTQSIDFASNFGNMFENDVKVYGTQTEKEKEGKWNLFENDVKVYGTQTSADAKNSPVSLRMM